jgi:hypothetical protein
VPASPPPVPDVRPSSFAGRRSSPLRDNHRDDDPGASIIDVPAPGAAATSGRGSVSSPVAVAGSPAPPSASPTSPLVSPGYSPTLPLQRGVGSPPPIISPRASAGTAGVGASGSGVPMRPAVGGVSTIPVDTVAMSPVSGSVSVSESLPPSTSRTFDASFASTVDGASVGDDASLHAEPLRGGLGGGPPLVPITGPGEGLTHTPELPLFTLSITLKVRRRCCVCLLAVKLPTAFEIVRRSVLLSDYRRCVRRCVCPRPVRRRWCHSSRMRIRCESLSPSASGTVSQ